MTENTAPDLTVEWRIEQGALIDYPHFINRYDFLLGDLQNTTWRLEIGLGLDDLHIWIYRQSECDAGPKQVEVECDLDILVQDDPDTFRSLAVDPPKKLEKKFFFKGQRSNDVRIVPRFVIDSLTEEDVLLLRCRMWRRDFSSLFPVEHFVRSVWKIEYFTWKVKNFSSFQKGDRISYVLKMKDKDREDLTFHLFFEDDSDTICIQEASSIYYYWIQNISILDSRGGKFLCLENCFPFNNKGLPIKIPLLVTKSKLKEDKEKFLTNNQLTLCFDLKRRNLEAVLENIFVKDFTADDGTHIPHIIRKTNNPLDMFFLNSSLTSNLTLSTCDTENYSNIPPSYSGRALYNLFNEKNPTDLELRIGGQTIRVHKSILATRCPVFLEMVVNKMRESSQKGVEIESLEIDEVKNILHFVYLNTVPELDWKSTMKLYTTANIYSIVVLRKKCSDILKSKLCVQNVYPILSLADTQADDDLKDCVLEFISQNWARVISSEEWEKFFKDEVTLASQVLLYLYKK